MGKKKQDKKRKEQKIAKKQVGAAKQAPAAPLTDEPPNHHHHHHQPKKRQPPTRQEWSLFPALQYMSIHYSVSTDACVDALMVEQSEAMKATLTTAVEVSTRASREEKQQQQQLVTETADKAIAKHFRRASVRVHPDRFGDTYLTEFEHLKESYDILKNQESRMEYASKMLDVIRTFGPSAKTLLQQAHDAFARDHFAKQDKSESAWARYEKAKAEAQQGRSGENSNKATATSASAAAAYIEAEHYGRAPGWLDVYQQSGKTRQLELGLKFRDLKEYQKICKAVVLQAEETADSTSRFVHRIEHDKLQSMMTKAAAAAAAASTNSNQIIKLTITLPTHTMWKIRWYAELQLSDNEPPRSITTSMTYCHVVDLTHPAVVQARQEMQVLQNNMTKRHIALLRNHIHQLQQQQQRSRQGTSTASTTGTTTNVLEAQSWELHRALSRGRSIATRLRTALEILDRDPEQCKELTELLRVLTETSLAKSSLDELVCNSQRRDTLKSFKQSVACMIESGECGEWIQKVNKGELSNHGAEVNRLYQLLIEGKKANSLLVDATTLTNAAARDDLFSTKQCKMLQERASEVQAEMVKETERMMEEERQQKARDEARRQMEERAQQIGMERGVYVTIVGLKNRPELNGQLGYYMGVAHNTSEERYIVKLGTVHPPKEIALKKENFRRWEGNVWSPTSSPLHGVQAHTYVSGTDDDDDDDDDDDSVESVGPEKDLAHENKIPSPVVSIRKETLAGKSHHHAHATDIAANSGRPSRTQNTAWIPRKFVRKFIGTKGMHIQSFQHHTRTWMHLAEEDTVHTATGDWVPVKVQSGSKQDIQNALDLIEAFDGKPLICSSSPPSSPKKGVFQQLVNKRSHPSPSKVHQRAPVAAFHCRSPVSPPEKRSAPAHASLAQLNAGHSVSVPKTPPPGFPVEQHRNGISPGSVPSPPQGKHLLSVLEFLTNNKTCLKVLPNHFAEWLQSQDILSLDDLAEATHDEEFMVEMQNAGLKGFKKAAFKKAVLFAVSGGDAVPDHIPTVENGLGAGYCGKEGPADLYCPISMVLMQDPVLAADGFTYERSAIVAWFEKNAMQQVVLSPMTQEPLRNLELTPNVAVRNLALSFA